MSIAPQPEPTLIGETIAAMHRRLPASDAAWDQALWLALDEAGLSRIGLTETLGGSGGGIADAADAVRTVAATGRRASLAETALAAGAVAGLTGLRLPPGPVTVAPAGHGDLDAIPNAGSLRLRGRLTAVPWGSQAASVLVSVHVDGRPCVAVSQGATATGDRRPFAAHPVADLVFDDVVVPGAAFAPWPAAPGGCDPLLVYGSFARSVQMLGALEGALRLSTDHVTTREQFGRPLAAFQAVQQQMAEFAGEVALARSAVDIAIRAAGAGILSSAAAAAVKIATGSVAGIGTRVAHQVHGAIGFTDEYALSGLTRSLWSWRQEFGTEGWWSEHLLRALLPTAETDLWAALGRLEAAET